MSKASNPVTVPHLQDIREALAQPGCPYCRLLARSADRYLDAILWEQVNDPETRSELNHARGYCRHHGWMLARVGAALGVAILSRDVIKTLLDVVESTPIENAPGSVFRSLQRSLGKEQVLSESTGLVAALSPQVACPVCSHLQDLEAACTGALLDHLEGPEGLSEIYRASDGLCLEHVRRALAHAPSAAAANALLAAQRPIWQRLDAELAEFIRKSDQRFRDEPFGSERDSWRRALEALYGPPPGPSARQSLTQSF